MTSLHELMPEAPHRCSRSLVSSCRTLGPGVPFVIGLALSQFRPFAPFAKDRQDGILPEQFLVCIRAGIARVVCHAVV